MRRLFLFIISITAIAMALTQRAMGDDLLLPVGDDITEEADSVVEITPDSLMTIAGDAFKALMVNKHEGMDNGTLFPEVYSCYELTLTALEAQQRGDRNWLRCKEILRDLDNDMLVGAFYYQKQGRQEAMSQFLRTYLDIQLMPEFEGDQWQRNPQIFPDVTYIAASEAYNKKEWDRAIDYFKLYFSSGDTARREKMYIYMGQAALNGKNYPLAISTMLTGMELYPANDMIPMIGVQACVDGGHAQYLQKFLTKAMEFKPQDERLLKLQGELYEDDNKYREAIAVFTTLDELKPNSLSVVKHLGMNYYNLAVSYFNQAINEGDEKNAKKLRRQAKNYYDAAANYFRQVLDTNPTDVKIMKHLGYCYLCLEDKSQFAQISERLTMLGEDPLSEVFMPPVMAYTDKGMGKNFDTSGLDTSMDGSSVDAPEFAAYLEKYVTEALGKWSAKKEFEPMDEYNKRVNDRTIQEEAQRLKRAAAEEYLRTYGNKLRLNELKLEPYDATNEVFMVSTNYGPVYVPVPLKNGEAENFKASFAGVSIRSPRYYIDETGVRLSSLTFVMPGGKTYVYDNQSALAYEGSPDIDIDFNSILRNNSGAKKKTDDRVGMTIQRKSDVDENIPSTNRKMPDRVALVIANENYSKVPDVASALNDGTTFAEYCKLTMGMPDNNVILIRNGSFGEVMGGVADLRNKVEAIGPNAEVVVYYAGHGMPDENTKDAFLMPVDGNPTISRTCISLNDLYGELDDMNAKAVCVFIDACFSGAQRNSSGDMLASARAVVIKPKESAPKGNMLVLTAASGKETALPYAEKNHGLFTYYLLKKIQDSKGNVTLKDLSEYVIANVKRESALINSKPQTPTASTSGSMSELWRTLKLKP